MKNKSRKNLRKSPSSRMFLQNVFSSIAHNFRKTAYKLYTQSYSHKTKRQITWKATDSTTSTNQSTNQSNLDLFHLFPQLIPRDFFLVKGGRQPRDHVRRPVFLGRQPLATRGTPVHPVRTQETTDEAATVWAEIEVIVLCQEADVTLEGFTKSAHVLLQRFDHHADGTHVVECSDTVQFT